MWDERIATLHFVDLKGGALHSWSSAQGVRTWQLGGLVTALALTESAHAILCVTANGLECVSLESGARHLVSGPLTTAPGMRPNDGKCDPQGNLWVGTMDDAEQRFEGVLYRIPIGQPPQAKLDRIGVSNGLGWSPDGTVFYFTDSLRRAIYRFDFDAETGALGDRHLFADLGEGEGAPDGLAVDRAGYVWSAIWDGACILRYAPDGTIDLRIGLPVPRPTSLAFGGPDLATLYVTSARIGLSEAVLEKAPLSGALFAIEPGVQGLPATLARIRS